MLFRSPFPVAAVAGAGKGVALATGIADRFSDAAMGGTQAATPDAGLIRVYALEFALLRGLVGGTLERELASLTVPEVVVVGTAPRDADPEGPGEAEEAPVEDDTAE